MSGGGRAKRLEDSREHSTSTTQERDQYWEMEVAVEADEWTNC